MTIDIKRLGSVIYVRKSERILMYRNKAGIAVGRLINIYTGRDSILKMIL
jgi:hypothetical protein